MHPEIEKFIREFEEEAARKGLYRRTLGKAERAFLSEVWGPAFDYRFEGLKAEYPFKDFKGGDRFIDFVYIQSGMKLLMEIDGFTTHARHISKGEFDDHLRRQNDLVLSGWTVLRFSAGQVVNQPAVCQRQITQAIGMWWTQTFGTGKAKDHVWSLRKKMLLELAVQQKGPIKTAHICNWFRIERRTAHYWLQRFVREGLLEPVRVNQRVTAYQLVSGRDE